uniref:Uncharacterized protein n=1 Tax=Onchocerca volvulus TaxID=6282 RepID=A0A8R1TXN7_ONCVO
MVHFHLAFQAAFVKEPFGGDMPETDANVRNPDDAHSKTADNNSDNIQEECKSLKVAEKDAEDEDPDSHLAKIEIQREVKNRVKLYVLCDQRVWDDKGTGHVACVPSPEHQGASFIVVRLEHSEKNILESRILMDTIYQKQQKQEKNLICVIIHQIILNGSDFM